MPTGSGRYSPEAGLANAAGDTVPAIHHIMGGTSGCFGEHVKFGIVWTDAFLVLANFAAKARAGI